MFVVGGCGKYVRQPAASGTECSLWMDVPLSHTWWQRQSLPELLLKAYEVSFYSEGHPYLHPFGTVNWWLEL